MNVLISGCSGGGKSTLLNALAARGYATVPEPGRRIVKEETRRGGRALPWIDLGAFALRAIEIAKEDLQTHAAAHDIVFFDRGLVDAAVAYQFAGGPAYRDTLAGPQHYALRVYLAPPWPEISATDNERQHSFGAAMAEYDRLMRAFSELDYDACVLPKIPVEERVQFVLDDLR